MKVYVLTTDKSCDRLVNGTIEDYPSCLPEPIIVYGVTSDTVKPPIWYTINNGNRDLRYGHYCCYLGHLNILKKHYAEYPDEDLIILEDDVGFNSNFDDIYPGFIKLLPEDWDTVQFGGVFPVKAATEVSDGLLKLKYFYCIECMMYKASSVPKIIAIAENCRYICNNQAYDMIIAHAASKDVLNVYAPLIKFAYQKSAFSILKRKYIDRSKELWYRPYTAADGTVKLSLASDYKYYRQKE